MDYSDHDMRILMSFSFSIFFSFILDFIIIIQTITLNFRITFSFMLIFYSIAMRVEFFIWFYFTLLFPLIQNYLSQSKYFPLQLGYLINLNQTFSQETMVVRFIIRFSLFHFTLQHILPSFCLQFRCIIFPFGRLTCHCKLSQIQFLGFQLNHSHNFYLNIFHQISSKLFLFTLSDFYFHFCLNIQILAKCLSKSNLFQYIFLLSKFQSKHSTLYSINVFFRITYDPLKFYQFPFAYLYYLPGITKLSSPCVLTVFINFMQFLGYYHIFGFSKTALDSIRSFEEEELIHFYFCLVVFCYFIHLMRDFPYHCHRSCHSNLNTFRFTYGFHVYFINYYYLIIIKNSQNNNNKQEDKVQLNSQMSNKKTNARVQKWRAMLSVGIFKDPQLLKSRVRKGIPQSIRMIAWPELVKLKKHIEQRSVQVSYQKLVNSLSNNIYQISLDIPRTFPQEQDTKVLKKSMNNVLKSIAILYPKVGYCQGMNFLASRVLQVLDDEEAFWLLDYLFQNDRFLRNNFIDPKHIDFHNYIFDKLLNKYCPQMPDMLTQKGIHIHAYTMNGVLRQQFFNRVFQVYLLEGWSIIYAVAVTLFKRRQKQFKSLSMQQIHLILGKKIFDVANIDQVMDQAYKLNLTPYQVNTMEKQYLANLRESQKLKQTSDIQRREKSNKNPQKFVPQRQNVGILVFQNKAEEVNFDALYILKNQK